MATFAIPLVLFTAFLAALLVNIFREEFDDPIPLRASITWAVSCPVAGLLYGVGLGPLAVVSGVISVLALGSLAYWFLVIESDDGEEQVEQPVEPDPGSGDALVVEVPERTEPGLDWAAFDGVRAGWEREVARPEREPERSPAGV
jgi:hypothetical protein